MAIGVGRDPSYFDPFGFLGRYSQATGFDPRMPMGVPGASAGVKASLASQYPSAKPKPQTPEKAPWMQREGPLGLDKQTWLMGGLGLLAGNRNTGPQMMLQSLSRGMENQQARQAQAKQQAKMDKFRQGLTPEQAMLFDVAPNAVAGGMAQQMFAQPAGPEYFKSGDDIIGVQGDKANVIYDAPDKGPERPWWAQGETVDPMYLQAQTARSNRTTVNNNMPGQPGAPTINDYQIGQPVPAELFEAYLGRPPSEGMGAIRTEVTEQNPFGLTEIPVQGGSEDQRLERRKTSIGQAATTVLREAERGRMLMDHMVGYRDMAPNSTEIQTGAGPIMAANARIAASKIPGTAEYQFMQNIESARSNIGLDRLQQMRENSPTGGALGQVPVQQQLRLEQVLGALDVTMPRPVMEENLKYLHNAYLDIAFGTASERKRLLDTGRLTPEENNWIESNYHSLNWDNFGNYQDPSRAGGGESVVGMRLPDGSSITEEDIQTTMEATGRSRQDVEAALRKRAQR